MKFMKLRKEMNEQKRIQKILKVKHIRAMELSTKLTLPASELRILTKEIQNLHKSLVK